MMRSVAHVLLQKLEWGVIPFGYKMSIVVTHVDGSHVGSNTGVDDRGAKGGGRRGRGCS